MFSYRHGFEIDGSDTSYDVILPEITKREEFVRFYLSLPIWNRDAAYDVAEEAVCANIRGGHADLTTFCLAPEALPEALRADIGLRAGGCAEPGEGSCAGDRYRVGLAFAAGGDAPVVAPERSEKAGAFAEIRFGTHAFSLTCGPGFMREYAAYLVGRLAERFPDAGIRGGA